MKKKYTYFVIIALIVASFAAFGRIAGNDFINLDDPGYITDNHIVQSGLNLQNIKWAFTAVVLSNWHPLTLLSHMADWRFFGADASGHHIVSLLLHIGAVIFLFLFLNKTTNKLWPAAFAAAFFALHPLRVESVAWAAERKDVLSMFFGMACLYAYTLYCSQKKLSRYLLCLIAFALSLISKPMLVTLPFVLMLLDFWPLNRWHKAIHDQDKKFPAMKGLIWEKIPLICLSIASSTITLWTQGQGGAIVSTESLSFFERVSNAIVSYAVYLGKIFWPVNLAVFYPHELPISLWKVFISGIILLSITVITLYCRKKQPFLLVGWFWYLGTLIPVIGLVQVGGQAMADRYTYLPSIGIAIGLGWGIPFLVPSEKMRKKILFPIGIAIMTVLSILSWRQCGIWENSLKLYTHALKVTENNHLAHNNLGVALFEEGKFEEAIYHCSKAIQIAPRSADARVCRGNAYAKLSLHQQSIDDYNKAIFLKPDYAECYFSRGDLYGKLGQYQRALEEFNQGIRLMKNSSEAYNNRGICHAELGCFHLALEDFNEAIRLMPQNADALKNRAVFYFKQGKNKYGCHDARQACAFGNCHTWEIAKKKGYCR
jgi:protein O-mannosyl-transferase